MTGETGQYDASRVRGSEQRRNLSLPWAVIVSACGALIGWGISAQRITDLERRSEQHAADIREIQSQVAGHDTKLEVDRAQYAEIIRRLNEIDSKIERQRP